MIAHAAGHTAYGADTGTGTGATRPTTDAPPDLPDFDRLYQQYGQRVLNLVHRFVRREEIARDLTQEIFIKVYENLASFRSDSQPYTWIHRIAVNHVMNHLKREKRGFWTSFMEAGSGDDDSGERERSDGVSDLPQPDAALEQEERRKIIADAVDSLPLKYRVPFMLFRYEERSYQEIADTLGLSLSAVETRIHRAKKQLIERLQPWLDHI